MTLQDRESTIAARQQAAHDLSRAGEALFGHGWKAPLAALLKIRPSTLDDMSTGRSRIPPALWNDISTLAFHRRKLIEGIEAAVRFHAGEPPYRLYRTAGGYEFMLRPDAQGRWPTLHHNGSGGWTALADDERRLPDTAGMFYLAFEGIKALPTNVMRNAAVHYPKNFIPV